MSGRFDRQTRFGPLGPEGQERIERARVLVVGCGALGGVLAGSLARAGVGELALVDRDLVDETNLHRQVLFDERHAREGWAKVDAAADTLARIGGPTRVETFATHLDASNVRELARGADLVLDGTDNLATRYLVNDLCVRESIPWIYGGVVGGGGLAMAVLPGHGACLRCLFPEPPPAGTLETCETAGVIGPAVGAIASVQAGLALHVLARPGELAPRIVEIDAWSGVARSLPAPRAKDCPACVRGEFPFLDRAVAREAEVLCGRAAVQVRGRGALPDLARLERTLVGVARDVRRAGPLLRFAVEGERMTLFADGRAIVEGTEDPSRALLLYDRYVGT